MEAPIQAMRNLKTKFEHCFSCDVNEHARATIEANFPHGLMYEDLTKRDNSKAPKVDLYVAGFPCQPFSSAGLQQGFKDRRGRGKVFFHVLDFLARVKPRVFILENVSGLVNRNGGKYLAAILNELAGLKVYNVKHQILNTKEHGVPHNRNRWYCVGILKEFDDGSFSFPERIKCPPMELFLEKRNPKVVATGLPLKTATTAVRNVKTALRTLKREGSDPLKDPFIVDCDSSSYRFGWIEGVTPCMTVGRAAGHWITNRGRRLTKEEMMRLQGMNPTTFKVAVSDCQLGQQLGNTMSVNVLERLLVRLLPAAKLVRKGAVNDRWANGRAVRELSRTRGHGFMGLSQKAKKFLAKKMNSTGGRRGSFQGEQMSPKRRAPSSPAASPKRLR
jgi:DNA (cytosine-5)-methyltransferase 1